MIFDSNALLIIQDNASITTKKINGESGSPCLIPFSHLNVKVGDPLTKTEELADLRTPDIQEIHLL
ncbi:hypothetical protein HanRHA438_Chr12g0536231 [Helianthus annuus]|nr:hypothetical protein HanRHA438_Chr12g0536231 [Helianthus annuus]